MRVPTKHAGSSWPLIGLPLASIFLPWGFTFKLLRHLARSRSYFDEFIDPAIEPMSTAMGPQAMPAETFRWRYRLLKMIDQVDAWLVATRSRSWIARHVDVEGTWPSAPFVAMGFHYGAGAFALKHLRSTGTRGHFLAQRVDAGEMAQDRVSYWSQRLRERFTEFAAGTRFIATGGSFNQLRDVLSRGEVAVVLADSPQTAGRKTQTARLLGREFALPTGVLELARQSGVPLIPWSMHFDHETGRRKLKIYPALPTAADNTQWTNEYAGILEALMREDPSGWHLWPQFSLFTPNAIDDNPPSARPCIS
jgi:phosphatidylinositol dimannoside acyltransferase